ncbi:MAG: hypothetical protein JJU24_17855 [Natronohydrobacter sp.]|nr:hypothetical protein [Natronohydrobacter sp.]
MRADHIPLPPRYLRTKEGTMQEFILKLHADRQADRTAGTELLENAAKRLNDDLRTLSDRIRDPHPLRETVFGSIRDFFK